MTQQVGIIDCGTNTFHLLIASIKAERFEITSRIKRAVKLGAGGINNNIIQQDAIERAMVALSEFKKIIQDQEIELVYGLATSAFRNASNGLALKNRIYNELRIPIDIISGDREAELIFKGVRNALNLDHDNCLVMDIGGGSVEFIIGNKVVIHWKKSFEIGGQRLVEKFHHHDPITLEETTAIDHYLDQNLSELFKNLDRYKPKTLGGSSGTFDTLSEIYCEKHEISFHKESAEVPFSIEEYDSIHRILVTLNKQERLKIPGMIPMRVDMIVVASCLINYIFKRYKFEQVRVSTYSLKEGLLTELSNIN